MIPLPASTIDSRLYESPRHLLVRDIEIRSTDDVLLLAQRAGIEEIELRPVGGATFIEGKYGDMSVSLETYRRGNA
jgi:hypothetical protein